MDKVEFSTIRDLVSLGSVEARTFDEAIADKVDDTFLRAGLACWARLTAMSKCDCWSVDDAQCPRSSWALVGIRSGQSGWDSGSSSSRSSSGRILGDLSSIPSILGLYGGGVKRHSEGHLVLLFPPIHDQFDTLSPPRSRLRIRSF